MTEVLRYEVGSGTVLVEVDDDSYGVDHPARNEQGILDAGRRLEDALASVRPAAIAAVESMPSADGHFILRMSWSAAAVSPLEEE